MTKEKKTFAWDTILLIKEAGGPMFVRGTDIEVEWCPITKMFWEVQTMKNYKLSYKYWLGYIVGTIERFVK